jgi:hypothetical protein
MTTNDIFDFAAVTSGDIEAYHPPTAEVLTKGNYVVKIVDLENTTSSGGYPMLKLTLENEQGRQWDNLVISPNEFSVAKLLGLIDAAKLLRPDVAAGEMSRENGALSDAYAMQLLNRTVGLIVRDEEDNRPDHFGESRPRVKGYVDPAVLSTATTGPLGGSMTAPSGQSGSGSGGNAGGGQRGPLAF